MAGECYPLWDLESGNMLYAYDTEEEALNVVRAMIEEHGEDSVRSWALERERHSRVTTLARGDDLIKRARTRPLGRAKRLVG